MLLKSRNPPPGYGFCFGESPVLSLGAHARSGYSAAHSAPRVGAP